MRLQANKTSQNTPQQTSQKIEKEKVLEEELKDQEEEEEYDEDDDEDDVKEEKPISKPQETPSIELNEEERIMMEIELLQNTGRFRVELLHQITEINKALRVIAGVLVELTSNETNKEKR